MAARAALVLAAALSVAGPSPSGFPSQVRLTGHTYHFDTYEVSFPSPARSRFPANDTVWGTLYLPRVPKPRAVLMLPVMAAPNLWIEHRFIYGLLRQRYAVLQLDMPYQFRRTPSPGIPSGQVFLARTPKALAANFRQAVLDARRGVSWLRDSGLVDPDHIALFGTSLGALVGSIVLSVEDRLAGGLLLLGGADLASLLADGEMTREFMATTGVDTAELRRELKGLDPLDYKEANRGKNVELINVRQDLVIPLANALKLRDAFPDSHQLLLPLGHYSAMLHLLWLPEYAAWKMRAILD